MFQSFIPFPTAMIGEYPSNPLAVSFFGGVMALNTLLFMVLHAYILRNLMKPDLVEAQDPRILWKSWAGPLFYLLGAAVAWLYAPVAFLFYLTTPLFFLTPPSRAVEKGR
jgi:uncharacterized membrane protein